MPCSNHPLNKYMQRHQYERLKLLLKFDGFSILFMQHAAIDKVTEDGFSSISWASFNPIIAGLKIFIGTGRTHSNFSYLPSYPSRSCVSLLPLCQAIIRKP
jgi:hypothetical protein